ncbi:sulfatase [Vibrio chagasii]|uniref:sulfatase family protein n=1 Tax=Vibrio chagasii TaxID=170679 RepID=UPI003DA00DA7
MRNKSLLASIICASFFSPQLVYAEEQPLNLVIFYVDDLGYGDVGSYGHPIVQTPNIDRLAEEGIRYTQYYAPAPLCSPSRAGMLTGRTPYRTGVRSWIPEGGKEHIGNNEITLANLLKDKGYDTAIMGKQHLNGGVEMKDHPQSKDMGFEYSFIIPGGWADNDEVKHSKPTINGFREGKVYPDNFWRNGKRVSAMNKFSAEMVSDEVISYLEKREDSEKPFFLYIPYSEVHSPLAAPSRFLSMYSNYISPFAQKFPDAWYFDWSKQPYRGQGEYYANISFMDEQLGRVVDKIKAMGKEDNTIIIFTSDNGPVTREARKPYELNAAGETSGLRGRKDNLFEGGIRVPSIIKYGAEIKAGQVSDVPVTGLDLLPTLAEMMGFIVPNDRELDGQSITATFKNKALKRKKPMIWTIDMPNQDDPVNEWAIRDGDWKLILDRDEKPKYLFNISNDPYEMWNQLGKNEPILEKMLRELTKYKNSIDNDNIKAQREV